MKFQGLMPPKLLVRILVAKGSVPLQVPFYHTAHVDAISHVSRVGRTSVGKYTGEMIQDTQLPVFHKVVKISSRQ